MSCRPIRALLVAAVAASSSVSRAEDKAAPQLGDEAAVPPQVEQVAAARLAAPEELRAGSGVLAYAASGELIIARQRQNELICLADDPKRPGFQVACYHEELEPYMKRGRELRERGIDGRENLEARWREIDAGKLDMPKTPRALYVLRGDSYDPKTQKVEKAYLRWVIFTPYATAASTGLSLSPRPGAPWLMYPGTAGAHIMINP